MGISVSFFNKSTSSEDTHTTCTTMGELLFVLRLYNAEEELRNDYGFCIPALKAVRAMEHFLSRHKNDTWLYTREVVYVRQMLTQYNDMRKAGHKPSHFGGA